MRTWPASVQTQPPRLAGDTLLGLRSSRATDLPKALPLLSLFLPQVDT